LRDDDLVVRWGGEEFLVLVRPLPRAEADLLAHRLLCAFADTPVIHEGQSVAVTASIGYGVFPLALDGTNSLETDDPKVALPVDWERAIAVVDSAMYLAKAHGRNGACGITRAKVAGAAALEEAIRSLEAAGQDGRLELTLQRGPVVHADRPSAPPPWPRAATPLSAEPQRFAQESLS
jgi:predicted signal transduction protein with EAL and GGDEF domain